MSLTEIQALVATLEYKNWTFHLGFQRQSLYLQVQFDAVCSQTGAIQRQHGRKWLLSEFMTKTEIVRTAFLACLQAEIHEAHEHFRYRGRDVFNTHIEIDQLYSLAGVAAHDVRPPLTDSLTHSPAHSPSVPRGTDFIFPNPQSKMPKC